MYMLHQLLKHKLESGILAIAVVRFRDVRHRLVVQVDRVLWGRFLQLESIDGANVGPTAGASVALIRPICSIDER